MPAPDKESLGSAASGSQADAPSSPRVKSAILEHLELCKVHLLTRIDDAPDPETRLAWRLSVPYFGPSVPPMTGDNEDTDLEPAYGAMQCEIVDAVTERYPDESRGRIIQVIRDLQRNSEIYLDQPVSKRCGEVVWCLGPPPEGAPKPPAQEFKNGFWVAVVETQAAAQQFTGSPPLKNPEVEPSLLDSSAGPPLLKAPGSGIETGNPTPGHVSSADATQEKVRQPDDVASLAVAIQQFQVSRLTLRRLINDGRIKSYRRKGAARNAGHRVSLAAIGRLFQKRGS